MIAIFAKQRSRVVEAVKVADASDWGDPAPPGLPDIFPTRGSVWALLGTHQYWHIGQLMSIRAMLGVPPVQFSPHAGPPSTSASPGTKTDTSATALTIPVDGPRVQPKTPDQVSVYTRAEYDKAAETWGIPNNLSRTMGCHPQLSLTEVDYANSFIFQTNIFAGIPRPGAAPDSGESVLFPSAGFVDRVTKELVITLVSLLNRSRFSITHHSVIGFGTLSALVSGATQQARSARAEQMLLRLVDENGYSTFEQQVYENQPLYTPIQVLALRLAEKMNRDAHSVTDDEVRELRSLMAAEARRSISHGPLAVQFGGSEPDTAYIEAFVDGMLVELTWCIAHFSGLLNRWFTVLKVRDEDFAVNDKNQSFIDIYNATVPQSIRARNNAILGPTGWGAG